MFGTPKIADFISELEGFARQNLLDVFGNLVVFCPFFGIDVFEKNLFWNSAFLRKSRTLGVMTLLVFGFGGSIFCRPRSSSVGLARRTS